MTIKIQILHGYETYDNGIFAWERMVDSLSDNVLEDTDGYYDMYSYEWPNTRTWNGLVTDLDLVYRENQAVDGWEINIQNEARSLVVGDLIAVTVNGAAKGIYVVETFGFHKLTADEGFAAALKVRS